MMRNSKLLSACFIAATLSVSGSIAQAETRAPTTMMKNAAETRILDDRVAVTLPPDFRKMPAAQIPGAYPTANPRPKEVWYADTSKGVVSLAFLFPFPGKLLKDEHVPRLAEMMKKQMAIQKPTLATKKINEHTVSRLGSVAPDASGNGGQVYTITQLASFNNRLMMVTFNIPVPLKDDYLTTGEAILDSLVW